jgi:2-keto-4-pentenoate hydratase
MQLQPVRAVPPELVSALTAQRERRLAELESGAERVGWKLGLSERESIGGERVIGYLTTATRLGPPASYSARDSRLLHADAEVALQLRADVEPGAEWTAGPETVAGYAAAIELVDLAGTDDSEVIVAENVWHRAFTLGTPVSAFPAGGVEVSVFVNGEQRASGRSPVDAGDRVRTASRLLGAIGEQLRAGDWIITGAVVQVAVTPGDEVAADFGSLGQARVTISP